MVTDRIPEMKGVFQMSLVSQEPIKEGLLEIWVGGQRERRMTLEEGDCVVNLKSGYVESL